MRERRRERLPGQRTLPLLFPTTPAGFPGLNASPPNPPTAEERRVRKKGTLPGSVPRSAKSPGSSAGRRTLVSQTSTTFSKKWILVKGVIHWSQQALPNQVLIDSADDNIIDVDMVRSNHLPVFELQKPRKVLAIDGKLIEIVTHKTQLIKLILCSNHHEHIELNVISSPLTPVVLGLSWLETHNPHIDWAAAAIHSWSDHCQQHCLFSAFPRHSPHTKISPPDKDLTNAACEYHAFSKDLSPSLPTIQLRY